MGGLQVLETVSNVVSDDPSQAPKLVRWFALVFQLSATVSLRVDSGSLSWGCCPWCTHKLGAA